ncbi:L,D-transpeptidase family protein [Microbacterium pygmaeum]|uniref:Putative peptidoglycan binding domain-containing protein n=1 Tax=Microbacterium pygmaeum TaxID=370764 RepID=A0A1G8D744_9MICO|nr:L,D-transpeptidase family protein [Microbacterium pygmaeum]SDH53618.1 Putative peptidoglycan binding domain-containing protein [Microbacterium pygmaeum]
MTDVVTRPNADSAPDDDAIVDGPVGDAAAPPGDATTGEYAWAPAEPPKRSKHLGWWIGVPAGAAVIALVASSLVLIAPGTSIAGVPVGFSTPGAAADAVAAQLATTTVVLTGDGGDAEVTAAELGASVDSRALADRAFALHPMWNPTTWFADPSTAAVSIDEEAATTALREAAPALYTDPVDATIAFDAATASFMTTPAEPGTGVDVESVRLALQTALADGESRVELDATPAEVAAITSTATAEASTATLNSMLDTAGFYVGTERTVPIDRAVAASWITVQPTDDGTFDISADAAAIQPMVDSLAPLVNRAAENGKVITDSSGDVLREEAAGISGRALGDTSSVASDYATQLSTGNAAFTLPVTEVAPVITTLARRIEVNLSDQQAVLYENNAVVQSWYISSGKDGFNSGTGNFRINSKLTSQNMGNRDLTKAPYYFTPDVPYVMYYNGDEALHGTYWHDNFGNQMSHGCINMPVSAAEYVFDWAPIGTEVSVHY